MTTKYKKIVYIDNDNPQRAAEDVDHVKNALDDAGIPEDVIQSIELIADFSHEDREKMFEMVFSGQSVITSWSMYTATHYGSLQQLQRFLRTAASAEIKNVVYIDSSGMITEALHRLLRDECKFGVYYLTVIETNYILTTDNNCYNEGLYRLRVDLKGLWEPMFRKEKVDVNELLKTTDDIPVNRQSKRK